MAHGLSANDLDQVQGDLLLGFGNLAGNRPNRCRVRDAEIGKRRLAVRGRGHFLGGFRAGLGADAEIQIGLFRLAVQAPADIDLVQVSRDARKVALQLLVEFLSQIELLVRLVVLLLADLLLKRVLDSGKKLVAQRIGHIAQEHPPGNDVVFLQITEHRGRIDDHVGQRFGFVGKAGPFADLLEIGSLAAVFGRELVDVVLLLDLVVELQQAQGLFEVSDGHEDVADDAVLTAGLDDRAGGSGLVNAGKTLELCEHGNETVGRRTQVRPVGKSANKVDVVDEVVVAGHSHRRDRFGLRRLR